MSDDQERCPTCQMDLRGCRTSETFVGCSDEWHGIVGHPTNQTRAETAQTHEHGGRFVDCYDANCPDRRLYDAAGLPYGSPLPVGTAVGPPADPPAPAQPVPVQAVPGQPVFMGCCFKQLEAKTPVHPGTAFFQCPFCHQASDMTWDGPRLERIVKAKSKGTSPRKWHLWVDLETLGLDEGKNAIVEVAVVLQDHLFREVWCLERVIRCTDWSSAPPEVIAAHMHSGLLQATFESKISLHEVTREIYDYLRKNCRYELPESERGFADDKGWDKIILCGSSVHFDHRFMKAQMTCIADRLYRRIMDMSVFYVALPEFMKRIVEPPKEHRAMGDIRRSIALHQQVKGVTDFLFEFSQQYGGLRPEVFRFAQRMEETLRQHDEAKGRSGWKKGDVNDLIEMLSEEVLEIQDAEPGRPTFKEAVDAGNFAMMVADLSGDLNTPLFHGKAGDASA